MTESVAVSELRSCLAVADGQLPSTAPQGWLHKFSRIHTLTASGFLVGLIACWIMSGSYSASGTGAAVLLGGGALIGVPHGASDFLTAHRVFGKSIGRLWLPVFVLIYLMMFFTVLLAWRIFPTLSLLSFVLVSTLHFAREDIGAYDLPPSRVRWLARASTPLLPIVMLHLPEVSPFFATMGGQDAPDVEAVVQRFRAPLLVGWLVVLATMQLPSRPDRRAERGVETFELSALAIAALVLPPLVTFAVYFCLFHAVRHMAGLTAGLHPNDGRRAWTMSTVIIVPMATILVVLLAGFWSEVWGAVATDTLLCGGLQLVAALAVPHMILEVISRNTDRPFWMREPPVAYFNHRAEHQS